MADYPAGSAIKLERRGGRLTLTLNRPKTRNALTHEMMREIGAVIAKLAADRSVRALVVRGAGGHFCAGGDINFMKAMPAPPGPGEADPMLAGYRYFGGVLQQMETLPQAVIALVEGSAVGGGLGMVCCADVVIAVEGARFAIPEPRLGFIPSQIIPFITRRAGQGVIRRMAVTGARLDAAAAVAAGLAHEKVANADAAETALRDVLSDVFKCEPNALAAVKRLVVSVGRRPDHEVLDDAAATLVGLLRAAPAKAGMRAFLEKRKPPWAESATD